MPVSTGSRVSPALRVGIGELMLASTIQPWAIEGTCPKVLNWGPAEAKAFRNAARANSIPWLAALHTPNIHDTSNQTTSAALAGALQNDLVARGAVTLRFGSATNEAFVVSNFPCPEHILLTFAQTSNYSVLVRLAARPSLPRAVASHLAANAPIGVRRALLTNKSVDDDILVMVALLDVLSQR